MINYSHWPSRMTRYISRYNSNRWFILYSMMRNLRNILVFVWWNMCDWHAHFSTSLHSTFVFQVLKKNQEKRVKTPKLNVMCEVRRNLKEMLVLWSAQGLLWLVKRTVHWTKFQLVDVKMRKLCFTEQKKQQFYQTQCTTFCKKKLHLYFVLLNSISWYRYRWILQKIWFFAKVYLGFFHKYFFENHSK